MLDPNIKIEQCTYTTLPPSGSFGDYQSSNWETAKMNTVKGIEGEIATSDPTQAHGIFGEESLQQVLIGDVNRYSGYFCDAVDENGYQYKRTSDELGFDAQQRLDKEIEIELNKERARQGKKPKKVLGILAGDISKEDKDRIVKETTERFKAKAPETDFVGSYVATGVRRIVKAPITIVGGRRDESRIIEDADFRNNPKQAPYRIGVAKLSDGRIAVTCVTGIGKVYSNLDGRGGNFFAHTLIFPSGTNIEDVKAINWEGFPFKRGLNEQEMNSMLDNSTKESRIIPQLTGKQILTYEKVTSSQTTPMTQTRPQPAPQPVRPQPAPQPIRPQTTPTQMPKQPENKQILSTHQLVGLAEKMTFGENHNTRLESSRQYREQVKLGANVFKALTLLERKAMNRFNEGVHGKEDYYDTLDVISKIEEEMNPFSKIIKLAIQLQEYGNQRNKLFAQGKNDEASRFTGEIEKTRKQLDYELEQLGIEKALEIMESYKEFREARANRESMEKGLPELDNSYMRTPEFIGFTIVEKHVKSLLERSSSTQNNAQEQTRNGGRSI